MSILCDDDARELTSSMGRALACAVITGSALIEASMRRLQHSAQLTALDAAPRAVREASSVAARNYDRAADQASRVRGEARRALAAGRCDAEFWLTAPEDQLADRTRTDHGADPAMVGDPTHDRRWAMGADADEVTDVHVSAVRWQHASLAAEMLASHIAEAHHRHGRATDSADPYRAAAGAEFDVDDHVSSPDGSVRLTIVRRAARP